MSSILIRKGTVATLGKNNEVLRNHSLLIENDRIKTLAPDERIDGDIAVDIVIDASGKLVLPGFINAHMHFYSSFARGLGKAAPSKNFPEILNNLWWRLDRKLTLEDCYYSALIALVSAIRHGTTTLIDHHASPGAVLGSLERISDAVMASGLRASLCYELSDRDGPQVADEGIAENVAFIKNCAADGADRLRGLFGLHAAFTLSDKTLERAVSAAAGLDTGFHIHVAEDVSDQKHSLEKHRQRVVERLARLGVLGAKTICGHCVHVDDHELDLIKETASAVVHNPQSNMNNAVGVADIIRMTDRGIIVGLGTDAMTCNMLEELRSALWIQKLHHGDPSVGFMECLNTLTVNNAAIAARYWDCGLGELAEGNKADVILVDYETPTPLSTDTFGGHLIFGVSQSQVDTTIANGRILMHDKKLIDLDEKRIMARSLELSRELWKRF